MQKSQGLLQLADMFLRFTQLFESILQLVLQGTGILFPLYTPNDQQKENTSWERASFSCVSNPLAYCCNSFFDCSMFVFSVHISFRWSYFIDLHANREYQRFLQLLLQIQHQLMVRRSLVSQLLIGGEQFINFFLRHELT